MTHQRLQKTIILSMAAFCGLSFYSPASTLAGHASLPYSAHPPVQSMLIHVNNEQNDKDLQKAEHFIDDLAQVAIEFLSDETLSASDKEKKFEKLLNDRFDMRAIGRFAMGRYWRTANKDQQAHYLSLFNDMIIQVYSRRFSEYQGQSIKIISSRPEGKRDILVSSVIQQSNGPDISLDWRLRPSKNGNLKVIDLIVEGVSMALTQRSDFASVIQRGGGDVQILISHLEKDK